MKEILVLSGAGGLIYNLLPLLELAKVPKADRPDFKDWLFWLPFAAWPLLGGLLGYAYASSGNQLSPLLALNVGLSAPLIFRAMSEANPFDKSVQDPGGDDA